MKTRFKEVDTAHSAQQSPCESFRQVSARKIGRPRALSLGTMAGDTVATFAKGPSTGRLSGMARFASRFRDFLPAADETVSAEPVSA